MFYIGSGHHRVHPERAQKYYKKGKVRNSIFETFMLIKSEGDHHIWFEVDVSKGAIIGTEQKEFDIDSGKE